MKKYYLNDIESGETHEVSKETYENVKKAWKICEPSLNKRIGKPILFGTGGGGMDDKDLRKIFYNSQQYNNGEKN